MSAKVDSRKVMASLRQLREVAPEATKEAIGVVAENVVSEMKQRDVVPFKEGTLMRSHGWSRLNQYAVRIFANTNYAAAVHETHKTKSRWFSNTLERVALPSLEKAVESLRKKLGFK